MTSPLELLRVQVSEASALLERAAMVPNLNDDPVKEQLRAMAASVMAMMKVCEVGADIQEGISTSLEEKAGNIADKALEHVKSSTNDIVASAVPRVLEIIKDASKQRYLIAKLRVLGIGGGLSLVSMVLLGGIAYSIGFLHGYMKGELTDGIVKQMMLGPPANADAWGMLIKHNNAARTLAECKQDIKKSANGWSYCEMPVWLDSVPVAPTS